MDEWVGECWRRMPLGERVSDYRVYDSNLLTSMISIIFINDYTDRCIYIYISKPNNQTHVVPFLVHICFDWPRRVLPICVLKSNTDLG